jgi:hypothetical protein
VLALSLPDSIAWQNIVAMEFAAKQKECDAPGENE